MTEKWQALQRGGALLTISKQSGHILVHQFSHKRALNVSVILFTLILIVALVINFVTRLQMSL